MRILVFRRARASRFDWEWHNYAGIRYFRIGVASPTHHRWWAFTLYLYL